MTSSQDGPYGEAADVLNGPAERKGDLNKTDADDGANQRPSALRANVEAPTVHTCCPWPAAETVFCNRNRVVTQILIA
jgi:hypothetical protein